MTVPVATGKDQFQSTILDVFILSEYENTNPLAGRLCLPHTCIKWVYSCYLACGLRALMLHIRISSFMKLILGRFISILRGPVKIDDDQPGAILRSQQHMMR